MTTPNESRVGGPVNGVASGSLIVSRYQLNETLSSDLADVTAWAAHDRILDRAVRLTLLGGDHVAEALDSARRAALVADSRLSRVLDVGTDNGLPYVVTDLYGGKTLSEVVAGGMLSPGQARAIVGEVATALDVAARRGVHHLALRPEAIRVINGRVLVTGLGLDAGLAGVDQQSAERTSHADAVGLAALLYYAMTARWPGSPLEARWIAEHTIHPLPAQRDGAKVLSLSDARKDCPTDLVKMCDEVFAAGPPTTWDIDASSDGPQNVSDVVARLKPWGAIATDTPPPPPPPATDGKGGVARQSVRSAFDATAPAAPPGTPPPAPPVRQPATGRIHRGAVAATAIAAAATPSPAPPTTKTAPSAGAPASSEADLFLPTFSPVTESAQAYPPPRRKGFNPTPIVLLLVAAGVAFGLYWALGHAFTNFVPPLTANKTAEATATASAGAGGQPVAPLPADVRPVIESGTALDPEGAAKGDKVGEHPEAAPLAYDGAPETKWFTRTYRTPDFSGTKSGVGYAITLQQEATVSTIVLNTNDTGGNVQVRATSPDKPTEGPILAEGPLAPETELKLSTPTAGKTFVLWFTELPTTPQGKLRVELKEILVS